MPARSIDTATLAFGLVSIPVKIYSTAEHGHELHFHLLHEGCGERLHQQYTCPIHGVVDRDHMVKGYEVTKGNFVELDKQELAALAAVTTDEIALAEFVPAAAVDPVWIAKSYYLGPGKGGDRAYRLFRDALADSELVGIATYAARGKQYLVMVRPFEDGLAMHQLYYADERKPWSEVPVGKLPKAAPSELGLAARVIDQLRHDTFDPARYTDEVKERVHALIADKAHGGEIVAPPRVEHPEVADLMAALQASLGHAHATAKPKPDGHARASHRRTKRTPRAKPAARTHRGAHANRRARHRRG